MNKDELHFIFQRIRSSDGTAMEELFQKYQKLIINISFSIVKNRDIAEEVSQNVFFKIMQLPKDKLPSKNESSWLYAVVKNQSIDYLRKQNDNIDISLIYNTEDDKSEINKIIDKDTFNTLIECLDDEEKEIITLKILADFSFREIGLMLDMPTGTVQWKYYKAVHTLKIFISNLTMFVVTFLLYVNSKGTESDYENIVKNEKPGTSIDSVMPGGITTDSATINAQLVDIKTIGLFSISSIFLVLTIIFGIILAKYQQKRYRKTSK